MSDSCCGKPIDSAQLEAKQKRILKIVLLVNLITFVMMVLASMQSKASSLLSGSLDNLGDAFTYALSLAAISALPATKAKVALFKGVLILAAAFAVAAHIIWRINDPAVPIFETIGIAALLNLCANAYCLWLLTPFKNHDVNMNSVWECSRNDVFEGFAVLAVALGVWLFNSRWPDLIIASILLLMFLSSAFRVLSSAWKALQASKPSGLAS